MKKQIKFPYGISNFASIAEEGYYFVDKTPYIEQLENWGDKYFSFLRPRRMGKSLFVSVLEYYYGKEHKDKFNSLFGKYYIGKNPTPLANQFAVLKMDFSGIDTRTPESAYQGFLETVKTYLVGFNLLYKVFDIAQIEIIESQSTPEGAVKRFFESYEGSKIYLILDEYDHFTNELLTQDLNQFQSAVSQNGYVRKFYEAIKTATQQGIVDRIFITGVAPLTLDSLTSGFNISTFLNEEVAFHDMMGFTEKEVAQIIDLILENKNKKNELLKDLKHWYDGYRFHKHADARIYNSDMVLYFCKHFQRTQNYPNEMLDLNIAPDYGKLKSLLKVQNTEKNYELIGEILNNGFVEDNLVRQFSFEIDFADNQFTSLLFYMGYLTIQGEDPYTGRVRFCIPNYVIKELHWAYFAHLVVKRESLNHSELKVSDRVADMARGDIRPFLDLIQLILSKLSNRDYQNFDEKYIKVLMMSFLSVANIYVIVSERETAAGYIDLLLLAPENRTVANEYIFEIKYIKKSDFSEKQLAKQQQEARNQVLKYLDADPTLSTKKKLRTYTLVFVKDEVFVEEIEH
ncbi:MAG: AAA family ATPase [Bernardetiaceae bacterium]|nr:AAA family ATPase [Bernardetiaceae bacterium]